MLLRITVKAIYQRMITRLDANFLCPAMGEKKLTFLHTHEVYAYSKTQFFHSSVPRLNNPKLSMSKSAVQSSITLPVDGIPRVAKSDAQVALFDYLHCTRGLSFLDAEHISKNSPHFIDSLIGKVKKEQDVSRALPKFFRYHPINEFEPFFESLGLNPTEFASLLPQDLMFLCDDQALLDNYHALSNYGIPRSKIGRMYKELNEIFHHELGILDMKLKAYEQLGLSRSTVIKLVTCCPLLLVGEVNKAFIRVLERLKELGFDDDWIGGCVSGKRTYNWKRILDTLHFLGEVGHSDAQTRDLIRNDTALVFGGSGKQVYVVAGALLKLGLDMKGVYSMVSKNPQILSPKCAKNFWKALHFLFEIQMEPENIVQILCSHMKLLSSHSLKGPNTVLKYFDGNKEMLRRKVIEDSSTFFDLAFKSKVCNAEFIAARNPNNFVEKTEFLLRLGYTENSDEMVKALKRFRGRGDQLQERFDCLTRAGLDFNTVSSMVKQAPTVLNQSKDVLERKIHCLKIYLGYPVESIVAFPSYLCYDIERISARFSMYAWLRDQGAAKPMLSLGTLLACSDARFVRYYVNIHPEGQAIWANVQKSSSSG